MITCMAGHAAVHIGATQELKGGDPASLARSSLLVIRAREAWRVIEPRRTRWRVTSEDLDRRLHALAA